MAKFQLSELQKKIGLSILHNSKTAEELVKDLGVSYEDLTGELKEMMRLNLIKMSGYPLKYSITKEISEALSQRSQIAEKDPFKIRLALIIEAQALEEELLLKEMKNIESAMRKEKDFTVYSSKLSEPAKNGEYYANYLEAELSVKDFTSMVKLMYFYGPVSVEVLKPEKLELSASELQDGLGLMLNMIQSYNHTMLKLMNRQELEQFYKKIYSSK